MFQLSGKIKEIFEEQTFSSGFNKREFVITTDEDKYPQDISFECLKDKVSLIENLSKGQEVTVSFDIRGREWNGRYFVNLNAWKIESKGEGGGEADAPIPSTNRPPLKRSATPQSGEIDDDEVPF
ncbi:MAG: DUF3127 domain-containing protein [Puniceicoccaceae bacterium]